MYRFGVCCLRDLGVFETVNYASVLYFSVSFFRLVDSYVSFSLFNHSLWFELTSSDDCACHLAVLVLGGSAPRHVV